MTILLSFLLTFFVFGAVGFLLSRRFTRPVRLSTWIVLAIGTFLSNWILPGARLLSVFSFEMFVNHALQALFAGALLGLAYREFKPKLQKQ